MDAAKGTRHGEARQNFPNLFQDLATFPGSDVFFTADLNKVIRMWNFNKGGNAGGRNPRSSDQSRFLRELRGSPRSVQSLALSGDGNTLAVAAVGPGVGEDSNATGINGDQSNDLANGSGAVYVYARSGGAWSQQAYVKASNTGARVKTNTAPLSLAELSA